MKRQTVWAMVGAAIAGVGLGAGAFRILSAASEASIARSSAGGREASGADEKPGPGKLMYNCAMHPNYISDKPGHCPICGMALVPMDKHLDAHGAGAINGMGGAAANGVRIDAATLRNMGTRTVRVEKRAFAPAIRTSGRITVDEKRQFSVNARVAGFVEKLMASTTGQAVRKDETLLELYSPELVSTQEEYLQALRYAKGLEGKGGEAAAAELVESSRRRLANWDVPEAEIRALETRGAARRNLPVTSPAAGVVMEKMVLQGQSVSPGMPLYRIADLSRVWVVANAYQGDLARIKTGSPAEITLSNLPGRAFQGKVAFVSPVLDPGTRTAEVRIEVGNTPGLDLKPEMFATVVMHAPVGPPVVAVPEQAVIRSGRRDIAVVASGDGYFEPRDVKLGAAADGYVEVLEGVKEGESLVVASQFLIDSESNLKSAIEQMQARPEEGAPVGASAPDGNDSARGAR